MGCDGHTSPTIIRVTNCLCHDNRMPHPPTVPLQPQLQKRIIQQTLKNIKIPHHISIKWAFCLGPRGCICKRIVPADCICLERFSVAVTGDLRRAGESGRGVCAETGAELPGACVGGEGDVSWVLVLTEGMGGVGDHCQLRWRLRGRLGVGRGGVGGCSVCIWGCRGPGRAWASGGGLRCLWRW